MTQSATALRRRDGWLIALAALALLAASWNATSELVFFSSDTGLRFMQIHSLVSQGWQTFAIDYPPRVIDPELRHVPYYTAYSIIGGELYFNIGALFPLLASLLYAGLGSSGLCLIPAAASLQSARATAGLAGELGLPRPSLFFLATLGLTPLAFYAMVLWDHSLIAALCLCGLHRVVVGLRRGARDGTRSLLWGGALIGIATTQRPEAYIFAVAVATGLLAFSAERWRACAQLATGGLLGASPLWLVQYLWVGHPLGMGTAPHLSGSVESPPEVALKLQGFLASSHPADATVGWAAVIASLGTLVLLAALRWGALRSPWALALGFCGAVLGYGIATLAAVDVSLGGIAITFALLPLSLASLSGEAPSGASDLRVGRLLAWVVVIFSGAVIALWPYDGGLQWGVRYLLPVYPLLLLLAVQGNLGWSQRLEGARLRVWRSGAALLLALALVMQGLGVRQVFLPKERFARIRANLLEMAVPFIITDHVHLPSYLTSMVPLGTSFVRATDDAQVAGLVSRFAASGGQRIGLSPSRRNLLHVPRGLPLLQLKARELRPHSMRRIVLELD